MGVTSQESQGKSAGLHHWRSDGDELEGRAYSNQGSDLGRSSSLSQQCPIRDPSQLLIYRAKPVVPFGQENWCAVLSDSGSKTMSLSGLGAYAAIPPRQGS